MILSNRSFFEVLHLVLRYDGTTFGTMKVVPGTRHLARWTCLVLPGTAWYYGTGIAYHHLCGAEERIPYPPHSGLSPKAGFNTKIIIIIEGLMPKTRIYIWLTSI